MARRRFNRMPPPRFALNAGECVAEYQHLWRELRYCIVPSAGRAHEIIRDLRATTRLPAVAEANGPAIACVAAGTQFVTPTPWAIGNLFTVFSFFIKRSNGTSIESFGGYGSSWTFQENYTGGQIGMTLWDWGNYPTTMVVPVGRPSTAAVSCRASEFKFMLNGQLASVFHGAFSVTGSQLFFGQSAFGASPPDDTSIHVQYYWNRALSDEEMLELDRDPWAPLRQRAHRAVGVVSALTGMTRVSQMAAEVLQSPDAPLRVSQLVAEVLIPVVGKIRVSQILAEVLVATATTGRTRVSALATEVLRDTDPAARVSALLAEVLRSPDAMLRVTQLCAEVLRTPDPAVRFTQLCAEVLVTPAALSVPLAGQLFPRGSPLPFPYT